MMSIRSKIGVRRVAMWLGYVYVLCLGIWLSTFSLLHFCFNEFPAYILLFLGLSFCATTVYGFVWDHKNVHSVVIDKEKIVISKLGTYYWNELETVDLYAKKWVSRTRYKAILLKLKSGGKIYLYDFAYSNTKKMRDYLQEHVIERK